MLLVVVVVLMLMLMLTLTLTLTLLSWVDASSTTAAARRVTRGARGPSRDETRVVANEAQGEVEGEETPVGRGAKEACCWWWWWW